MRITLKAKLLIGISVLIVALIAVLTFNNYRKTKEIIITKEEEHFSVLENIVQMEIKNYLTRGALLVMAIVEDQAVVGAFGDRDRYRLRMAVNGRFNALKSEGVNVLQFHLPDGTSFYRAHKPEEFGDSLLFRDTIKNIIENRMPISGLEEGVAGFSLRAIQPVRQFGRYIGSVEVGMDIGGFFAQELKEVIGSDLLVYSLDSAGGGNSLLGGTLEEDPFPVKETVLRRLRETGEFQYDYSPDGTKALVLIPLREFNGDLAGYIKVIESREKVLAQIQSQNREAVLISLAGLALVVLILWRVLIFFLKPLEALCRQMGAIAASGDLTCDALVAEEAEIGQVASSYNTMLGGMREILQGIRSSAGRLQDWSRRIATGSEEASAAGEELAAIAEQNTIGAEKQVEAIGEIKSVLSKMTEDTGIMARKAAETGQMAAKALEVTRAGEEYVQSSVRQMHQIGEANQLAVDKVRTLVARSEEIETLTRLIGQVADQTNLLALNAAIEAARAGEQGRGFAVVAEEVRKLAEEAAEMADKIGGTISGIVRDTEEVGRSMEASSQEIDKGVKLVNKAGDAFTGILAEVSEVKGFIDDISRLSGELAEGGQKIMGGIASVGELAMEAAGHAGQAAASTEEQAAFLTEMHRLAGELEKEVLVLEEVISKFLLEEIQVGCWEVMECSEQERDNCPAYQNEERRCWLIPHTWCGGQQQGTAEEKREACMNCRYFNTVFFNKDKA